MSERRRNAARRGPAPPPAAAESNPRSPATPPTQLPQLIYDPEIAFALRGAMLSGNPEVTLAAFLPPPGMMVPGPAAAGAAPGPGQPWGQQPGPGYPPQGHPGYPPQGLPPPGLPPQQQPPPQQPQPQAGPGPGSAQPPAFADALFPPGLLPDLVRIANRGMPGVRAHPVTSARNTFARMDCSVIDPPAPAPARRAASPPPPPRCQAYEPINPADIPAAPPPPGAVDSYLQSRLDRFYEDLADGCGHDSAVPRTRARRDAPDARCDVPACPAVRAGGGGGGR